MGMQVDFSHKAGAPAASEAHPVQHHVAMDMATEGLQGPDDGHWDVKGEVLDYVERMEWKHDLGATSARRYASPDSLVKDCLSDCLDEDSVCQVGMPSLAYCFCTMNAC